MICKSEHRVVILSLNTLGEGHKLDFKQPMSVVEMIDTSIRVIGTIVQWKSTKDDEKIKVHLEMK